jgi:hypothetical protein
MTIAAVVLAVLLSAQLSTGTSDNGARTASSSASRDVPLPAEKSQPDSFCVRSRAVGLRLPGVQRARQYLFSWTPSPGTALYVGYNDDMNYNGFSPFTGLHESGFRRNGRTFFIKTSYLFRRRI